MYDIVVQNLSVSAKKALVIQKRGGEHERENRVKRQKVEEGK